MSDETATTVFKRLAAGLAALPKGDREQLVKKTRAVFQFDIKDAEGTVQSFILDLKNDACGAVVMPNMPAPSKADATITIAGKDFVALASGKLRSQSAFASGKLKIKGQMMLAMKLDAILKSLQGAATSKM